MADALLAALHERAAEPPPKVRLIGVPPVLLLWILDELSKHLRMSPWRGMEQLPC